jgi:very-short-patch-repair endonuclease
VIEGQAQRTSLARKLRQQETDAERKLWSRIRGAQFLGFKFRRQVPVCGYVADFLCHEAKLIVELDGGQHAERSEADDRRSKELGEAGFVLLRFWNNDVLANIEGVLTAMAEQLRVAEKMNSGYAPHPVPLPMGEGTPEQRAHADSRV